jgi:hypothetical protein
MGLDVLRRSTQQSRVITEPADPVIAAITDQRTDLASHVIMIGMQAARCPYAIRLRRPAADGAESVLRFEHCVMPLNRQAVLG